MESIAAGIAVVLIPFAGTHPAVTRVLTSRPTVVHAVVLASLLAAVGLIAGSEGWVGGRFAIAAAAPIAQLLLLNVAVRLFRRIKGRDPVDAAFNWSPAIGSDRVFALVVGLGGTLPFLWFIAAK